MACFQGSEADRNRGALQFHFPNDPDGSRGRAMADEETWNLDFKV